MTSLYVRGRPFLPGVLVTLVCVLLLCATGCAGGKNVTLDAQVTVQPKFTSADTWNKIYPMLMFDGYIVNPAGVAPRYDFVSSAKWYNLSQYRAANPNMFLTYYMPFHRDNGTYMHSNLILSLAQWQAVHPDWILYKCDRVTPAYEFGDPAIPFDFSNPAVENYQVQTYGVPASLAGYNGITADNVNMENLFGACGTYQNGIWVQRYSGAYNDPRWQADVVNWLTAMQQSLHSLSHPLALIPNLAYGPSLTPTSPLIQQILAHSDGILDEAGFTHFGTAYLTDQYWTQAIQMSNIVQNQGKPFLIINSYPLMDHAAIEWALSSYLMAKGHSCFIYISKPQDYGIDNWYNEYNVQIGSPTNAMYSSQNVYWRNYTNGLSVVNPSSKSTFKVTLNAGYNYVDLYGNVVGPTVVLPPHSGLVLLALAQRHTHILG